MTTLWDTTGTAVVKALAAERRTGGAVMSGLALTLVAVVSEKDVAEAEAAATTAASRHPCRLLIVIRRQVDAPVPRLDAEVLIGGRLGPGEAVVMRMYGRLALHAESVTLPLLAPDTPVVTWWHGDPPDRIAHDPLGVFAERRVTDVCQGADPIAALKQRADDFAAGDTDLAWTRLTPWRAYVASAFETVRATPTAAVVWGREADPQAQLFAGWLSDRLHLHVPVQPAAGQRGGGISGLAVDLNDGGRLEARRAETGRDVLLRRTGQPDSTVTLPDRDLGDLLAEELRRLDADETYADALSAATGVAGLVDRPAKRTHIWRDPANGNGNGDTGAGLVADPVVSRPPVVPPAAATGAAAPGPESGS
ncbi:MAG TPA: glucose-6-phosphate dehydrogenase assembly protein OpcA [Mycobacteriales bacterium]|nr:glucose-6-phosphate dehydrogenase assembly protein OpcA [Mycobacteriales bacterium]